MSNLKLSVGSLSAALATYQYIESQHLETGQDKSIVYYNMGWIYFQQGQTDQAKYFLKKSLAINPADNEAKKLLSQVGSPEI